MEKDPLEMNFSELNDTLDQLLKDVNLPETVMYTGEKINYNKFNIIKLLIIGVNRLFAAEIFYRKQIIRRLGSFKRAGFLKSFKPYFYIFRIGLPDLLHGLGGKFDEEIAARYMIAAMFYDASCDVPEYRKYLKEFNDFIMFDKEIKTDDEYLTIFKESIDYVRKVVDKKTFETFMNYIKIEHISQLMSTHQSSTEPLTKDNLFKITLAKGGITIMAGIYLMAPKMTVEERKALYEVGGILQILEDIFDLKEDQKMGIQTMSNQQMISYKELKHLYVGSVNNMIEKCHLNPNLHNTTLDIFYWLVDKILVKIYAPFFRTEKKSMH
jgi:hypothetical protein